MCGYFFTASPPLPLSSSLTQCLAETVCSSALSSQQPSAFLLRELMVRTVRGNRETETGGRRMGKKPGGLRERNRKKRKRKCAAIEIFGASHGVSFVPQALTCPLHVNGIQAIKIYITAIECMLLMATVVGKELSPTQPVEILS